MNKFKCLFFSGLMAVMPACMNGQQTSSEDPSKPRVIITCDPELDDLNSLIRFLLFSTDFRVEGLIYASSLIGKVMGTVLSGMYLDGNILAMV